MMERSTVIGLLWMACLSMGCEEESDVGLSSVRYSADIAPIMENHCTTCHSGASARADLNLDNYGDVRAVAKYGPLRTRINDVSNPMPPSGLLSGAKRQKIQDWIDQGFQE